MKIKLTQGKFVLVDDIDYRYLSQWKWFAAWTNSGYYAKRNSPRIDGKQKAILMHRVIAERMGIDSKMIDHKDRNTLNNQRENLRAATRSQNMHNHGFNKNNTTGVKGVYFCQQYGRYKAQITVEGKQHFLGRFDTIPEAEAVVIAKRKELVGEFACA